MQELRALRLAELVLAGEYCDACAVIGEGEASERIPVVAALLAAASPVLRTRILPTRSSIDDVQVPRAVTARALRCVLAYSCGAAPVAWHSNIVCCPLGELEAAASVLDIPDLEAWCRQTVPGFGASTGAAAGEPATLHRRPDIWELCLILGSAILIVVTICAWWPAVKYNMFIGGFFMDDAMIRKNPNVYESIDWRRLFRTDYWGLEMFLEGEWTHKSFRPLTVLTFRWNYWLHTFDSSGFHITNLLLHACCSLLLGVFASVAFELRRGWTLLLVALFLAHPVHTENVLYIVGRADLLCLIFVFLGTLVYAPCALGVSRGLFPAVSRILLAAMLTVAAGLCKETGFCFFGLLAGWEILQGLLVQGLDRSIWRWVRLAALLALGTGACCTRWWYTGGTGISRMDPHSNPVAAEADQRVRVMSYALVHGLYAKLLVWPTFLCYDYSLDAVPLVRTLADARLLLPVTAYLAFAELLCCACWPLRPTWFSKSAPFGQVRRKLSLQSRQTPIVGLAIVILSFVPMSNVLFPVGTVIGERLLYIPSAGLLLAVVGLAQLAGGKASSGIRWSVLLLAAGAAFAWLCARRVPEWESSNSITTADGLKQTRSSRVQFNFANVHLGAKRYEEALATYQRAINIDPTDHDSLPLYHAGQILFYSGRNIEAERYLEKAVSGYFSPLTIKEEEIFHDYALALWFVEKREESILNFQKSLAINPLFTKSLNNLGCAAAIGALTRVLPYEYFQYGLSQLERSIQLEPANILYWRNAVAVLQHGGDMNAAQAAWQQVSTLDPQGSLAGPPQECTWEFYFR